MKKIIQLGKIDYNRIGRKTCPVVLELELVEKARGPVFTVCGVIYNHMKTDAYTCGQCLDDIAKYNKSKQFNEIYHLWKLYHCNDMHSGTPKQEAAVDKYLETNRYDYDNVCKHLESIGLLEDNGYRYGTSWLYEAIPDDDLQRIKQIILS